MKRRRNPEDESTWVLIAGALALAYWWFTTQPTPTTTSVATPTSSMSTLQSQMLAAAGVPGTQGMDVDEWNSIYALFQTPVTPAQMPALIAAAGGVQSAPISIETYLGAIQASGVNSG